MSSLNPSSLPPPPPSFLSDDFNPDSHPPVTSICITEMTEKGACATFDRAFDRCKSTPESYNQTNLGFVTALPLQLCVHQRPEQEQAFQECT